MPGRSKLSFDLIMNNDRDYSNITVLIYSIDYNKNNDNNNNNNSDNNNIDNNNNNNNNYNNYYY